MSKQKMITAVKAGVSRDFTEMAWKLMGKDKNGYVQVPTEAINSETNNSADGKPNKPSKKANPIANAVKTSKDFTPEGVIVEMKKLGTVPKVIEFSKNDARPKVKELIARYIDELQKAEAARLEQEEKDRLAKIQASADAKKEATAKQAEEERIAKEKAEAEPGKDTENKTVTPKSTDEGVGAKMAAGIIAGLETIEAINDFVASDEERATVLEAVDKKMKELAKADNTNK